MLDLTKVRIRDLNSDEFLRPDFVKPFIENVTPIPNPKNSIVKVAEIDEKVIGFIGLQPYYFVEPLWVEEDCRGGFIWKNLFDNLISDVRKTEGLSLFVLSQNPKIMKMAKSLNFQELPYRLARRIL